MMAQMREHNQNINKRWISQYFSQDSGIFYDKDRMELLYILYVEET